MLWQPDAAPAVIEVPVYRWVRPENEAPLHRLIETVSSAGVDAVAFTSAPAAVSFLTRPISKAEGATCASPCATL
jgi:uroporphyrinogen-III synthase